MTQPPTAQSSTVSSQDVQPSADGARQALAALRTEIGKAVVGQDAAVTALILALLCRGHVLLEGVPGTAKTLMVRALATALRLDTKRVQFTPDLMPGDVTGSLVYDAKTSEFEFRQGPVAAGLRPVAGPEELAAGQAAVRRVAVREDVLAYIVDLCRATRQSPSLQLGVSPRGATALLAVARSWAWLSGRDYVIPDDVKAMARPALRHRIEIRPEAELEGVTPDAVLESVLATVPVPR